MARSRSRSPRWKQRSLSPAFRSPERYRQRQSHGGYDCDYKGFRKDPKRPPLRRADGEKYGPNDPRVPAHGGAHQRVYEPRSPSPAGQGLSLEDAYGYKPPRGYSPERGDGARRYQSAPKYPGGIPPKEHERHFYGPKPQGRYPHEEARGPGSGKGGQPFHRSPTESFPFQGPWPQEGSRAPRTQDDDQYDQAPRRGSEESLARSSFPKRYPKEERDVRELGPTSKRTKEGPERYETRGPPRPAPWRDEHALPPYPEPAGARSHGPAARRSAEQDHAAEGPGPPGSYDYRHRHPKPSAAEPAFSDGRGPKPAKQEERKYSSPKGPPAGGDRETDGLSGGRARRTEGGPPDGSAKYGSPKDSGGGPGQYRNDVGPRPFHDPPRDRGRKGGEFRKEQGSPDGQRDPGHRAFCPKTSTVRHGPQSLTVKVDLKQPGAQTRRTKNFHTVFEHLDSAPLNVENMPTSEFTQEIITIIHQIKANYFPPSDLTLHERFSKMQDTQALNRNALKMNPDPEIHRRIDMSLAELQNKRTTICELVQPAVRILEDPNDLRHDIERRRMERLQNEDERLFYLGDTMERNGQNTHTDGFKKPIRFMKRPFRKFIRKPYMSNLTDGRFQSQYKSGLVRKGLYFQAKYQHLRWAGSRGFTTDKCREEFLRKGKEHPGIAMEI
ncbi:BCLAF1 and THRAP3 family member 3 isoform X2 [Tachyglossus aculeatus]|uniref:BCLAF1 and THRAP3 family member 3 isoform X2 n=1 Tax=Tachyglossus aculeatus TaxID=9261 RepID=UPI0018F4D4DE|nr:BCLAF1 and THRAP3 family member 3 isoform X2 [Tachyglossus aculeatus]